MPAQDEVPQELIRARDAVAEAMASVQLSEEAAGASRENIQAVGLTRDPFPDGAWALAVHLVNPTTEAEVRQVLEPVLGRQTARQIPMVVHVTGLARMQSPTGVDTQATAAIDRGKRRRPVCCGISVAHYRENGSGTLGCLARRTDDSGQQVILSNNHVIALNTTTSPWDPPPPEGPRMGDAIVQPGPGDGGKPKKDTVAHLLDWVPLTHADKVKQDQWAQVDAAVAQCVREVLFTRRVLTDESILVPFTGASMPANVGVRVKKYGLTTGLTRGTVSAIGVYVRLAPPSGHAGPDNGLRDQVSIDNGGQVVSKGGDSGSLWIADSADQQDGRPVALLCGGNGQKGISYASRIELVEQALHIIVLTGLDPSSVE